LISKKFEFYFLALFSGVFTSFYVLMDAYGLKALVPDPYVYSFLCEWIGLITCLLYLFVLSIPATIKGKKRPIGYYLDPYFQGLKIPRGKSLQYILGAGLVASVSTITYFIAVSFSDPSMMLPLMNFSTIYLLIIDFIREKDVPSAIEIESVLSVTLGAFLVTLSKGKIDPYTIIITLVIMNGCSTAYTAFMKKLQEISENGKKNDSLNLRFWSLFFLTLSLSIMLIPFLDKARIEMIQKLFFSPMIFIFFTVNMGFAFLSYVMYIRALGKGKMSIVNAVVSINIVLGIPFTFLGVKLAPNVFESISYDAFLWTIKIVGTIFVIVGILALSLSEVKAYILLRTSSKHAANILEKIYKIRGVESVAAVAGDYDYIVKLRIRTLGKTYNIIVWEIEKIEGIIQIMSLPIIKEWEIP